MQFTWNGRREYTYGTGNFMTVAVWKSVIPVPNIHNVCSQTKAALYMFGNLWKRVWIQIQYIPLGKFDRRFTKWQKTKIYLL